MKRHVKVGVLVFLAVSMLFSQTSAAGWKMRVDRSVAASEPEASGPVKFITKGTGFQATNPRAGVYWNPAQTVTIDPPAEMTVMKTVEKHTHGPTGVRGQSSDNTRLSQGLKAGIVLEERSGGPDAWIEGQVRPKLALEVRCAMPA